MFFFVLAVVTLAFSIGFRIFQAWVKGEDIMSKNDSSTAIFFSLLAIIVSVITLLGIAFNDHGSSVQIPTPMATRVGEWVSVFTEEGEQANYKCVEVDTAGKGTDLIDCVKTWAGDGPISVPVDIIPEDYDPKP